MYENNNKTTDFHLMTEDPKDQDYAYFCTEQELLGELCSLNSNKFTKILSLLSVLLMIMKATLLRYSTIAQTFQLTS